MILNRFKNNKEQLKQIDNKLKKIEYVLKYGNGKISEVVPICYGSELNEFTFPQNTTIIELYKQCNRDGFETSEKFITEENLELNAKFFRGEYIPYIEAQSLLDKNMLNKIPLNKDEYKNYENLIKKMIEKQNIGIIICSGVPHIADANNTYLIKLNENGKIERFAPIEAIEISASEKYSAILQGKEAQNEKINVRTAYRMEKLTEFTK